MVRFDFDAAALITGMTMPAFVAVVIALVMMVDRVRSEQRKPYRNGIAPRMPAMSAMSFFGALNFALLGLLLGRAARGGVHARASADLHRASACVRML